MITISFMYFQYINPTDKQGYIWPIIPGSKMTPLTPGKPDGKYATVQKVEYLLQRLPNQSLVFNATNHEWTLVYQGSPLQSGIWANEDSIFKLYKDFNKGYAR